MCVCVVCVWVFVAVSVKWEFGGCHRRNRQCSLTGEVEETPVDDIDKEALDDATYEVYETPRKHFSTIL